MRWPLIVSNSIGRSDESKRVGRSHVLTNGLSSGLRVASAVRRSSVALSQTKPPGSTGKPSRLPSSLMMVQPTQPGVGLMNLRFSASDIDGLLVVERPAGYALGRNEQGPGHLSPGPKSERPAG